MLLRRNKNKEKNNSQPNHTTNSKLEDIIELGTFYFLNQKYDQAAEQFEHAIELDPKRAKTYYNLGVIYEIQHKTPEARSMFSTALELDANLSCAQTHLDKLVGGG